MSNLVFVFHIMYNFRLVGFATLRLGLGCGFAFYQNVFFIALT